MAPRPARTGTCPRTETASPQRVGSCARLETRLSPQTRSASGMSAPTYHSGRGACAACGAECRAPRAAALSEEGARSRGWRGLLLP
eukprot:1847854-Alexandrium_andersonii.AAC.1